MPPATRGRALGNLPLELTTFVGRRREVTEAKRLLAASRLVTLTGIGGVGKTRLALRVAEETARSFPDGVWLIELGELHDPALVPVTVAAAVGMRDNSSRPSTEMLVERLRDRNLLLVFDNCEHLVGAVAELADTVLRGCLGIRILATSREALEIGGEALLRVPPLAFPAPDPASTLHGLPSYDAVALFAERATAMVHGFEVTDENRHAVAEICRRLDGLPLSIELAAARVRVLSPDQILDRLTDRFRLLTGGHRGSPSRQQSLRLCVDWSHELCTAPERELWGRLAVFAGGFEIDAVEGVCAEGVPADEVLDLLASLVDKSILIREDVGAVVRYRMLETLREYGRDKLLEAGDFEDLRRRHRDWYQQLVLAVRSEWIGPQQVGLTARLDREQSNLREAMQFSLTEPGEADHGLRIAVALFAFWMSQGLLREGRYWLDRALSLQDGEPSVTRVKALCADSLLASNQGDIAAGTLLITEAADLAEQLGDPMTRALVMHAAGYLAAFSGDLTGALASLEGALEVFRSEGNHIRQISTLLGIAVASGLLGDTARAVECQEEALAISESTGESVYRAYAVCALGLSLWESDSRRSQALLEQGLRLTRPTGDVMAAAMCLEALAWIAGAERHGRRAAMLLGAARSLWRGIGSTTGVVAPKLKTFHGECERRTRQVLGDTAFEAAVAEGSGWSAEESIAFALDERAAGPRSDPGDGLTRREQEVAALVARGMTNKEIAAELVISLRTAQGHVERLLAKLGFSSRTQIAAWVVERAARVDADGVPQSAPGLN
ncbi:ATP-binding protein [Rhodococcus sp. NPDC059234]|uniref:ATP-binding protein n=1 Tax=Rhodococcus sp. NPDC059234 TaxID=3346781 RepID=UPI00366B7577